MTNIENDNNENSSTESTQSPELIDSTPPFSPSAKNSSRALIIAFLLSLLLIHIPLLTLIYLNEDLFGDQEADQAQKNKIDRDKVVMMDLNEMNLPPNIVDIDKPLNQAVPKKPTAQSLYNSSVKKETVAKGFNKKPTPLGQSQKPIQQQAQQAKQPQKPKTVTEDLNQKQLDVLKKRDEPIIPKSGLSMQEQLKLLNQKQKSTESQKYSDRFEVKNPSASPLYKSSIGSPDGGNTGEFLPNYTIGNKTYLNTLANPHIGYFVELRRKFRFAFNPMRALQGSMNELTRGSQLSVIWGLSVDPNGNIGGLTLIRSSGVASYDDEARQTIRKSAPFTKPPPHMLTPDKQLNMAWTFVTYL